MILSVTDPRGWWTGDHLVALATIVAALVAAAVAIGSYRAEVRRSRKERYAKAFAEAIQTVEDYLEAPYRIRRRPLKDPTIRYQLTSLVSDIQSRLAFHQTWLSTLSPVVAERYGELVAAAREEAGLQMTEAWNLEPTAGDETVPLGERYNRPRTDQARVRCLDVMRRAL